MRFAERTPVEALTDDGLTLDDRYPHAGGERVARAPSTPGAIPTTTASKR